MIVIKPYAITDAMLTSDIPEPDTGETVWVAGSYSIGDERISTVTHKIYKSIVDSNTLDPTLDVYTDGVGEKWLIVGPTNRWAFTDGIISNPSVGNSPLNMGFTIRRNVDGVAVFGLSGVSSAIVTVDDPAGGEVYNREVRLTDNSAVTGFYSYLFQPVVRQTQFVLVDLPLYVNATVNFEFNGSDPLDIGEIVLGKQIDLGVAVYGCGFKLLDFSIANTDEFGNFTGVTRRRFSKLVDFDVRIEKSRLNFVYNTLSDLRATSAVWIGEGTEDDATLALGYYRNNQININAPSYCSATIQVQSVI